MLMKNRTWQCIYGVSESIISQNCSLHRCSLSPLHFSISLSLSGIVSDDRQRKVRRKRITKASNYRFAFFFLQHIKDASHWHNCGGKTLITRPKETGARSFGKGAGRERATSRVFILASMHNWRIPLSSLLPRITEPRCTRGATRETTGRRQRRRRFVDTARRHGRVHSWYSHTRVQTPAPVK